MRRPIIVTTPQLCQFFSVSQSTIDRWNKAGLKNIQHGKWDLKDAFIWWQENIMASKAEEADQDINSVKLEYWQEKTRNERLKADKSESILISKKDVARQWGKRLSEVANGLAALPMRLPPLLAGKGQSEMRKIIDKEQKKVRDNYYRTGRFCINNDA